MGTSEHVMSRGINDPRHEVVEVELYYDKHHPCRRYFRFPADVIGRVVGSARRMTDDPLPMLRHTHQREDGNVRSCR
jgi:hypothetical protein